MWLLKWDSLLPAIILNRFPLALRDFKQRNRQLIANSFRAREYAATSCEHQFRAAYAAAAKFILGKLKTAGLTPENDFKSIKSLFDDLPTKGICGKVVLALFSQWLWSKKHVFSTRIKKFSAVMFCRRRSFTRVINSKRMNHATAVRHRLHSKMAFVFQRC